MPSPTQSLFLLCFLEKFPLTAKKLKHSLIYMIIIILNLKKQNPNFVQVEFQPKFQRNESFQRNFAKTNQIQF